MEPSIKRAAPGMGNGSIQGVLLRSADKKKFNQGTKLPQEQIDELLNLLPPKANQARRFIQLIGSKPYSLTNVCNKVVLSVNLSDLAVKYNPYLKTAGYKIKCRLPNRQIKNRHGESTMLHEWFLQRAEVANG